MQANAQSSPVPIEEAFGAWSFIHVPGSDVWTTGTESEKYEDIIVGVSYVAELGCTQAVFEYSMPAPGPAERLPDGDYPGEIEVQIDDLDSWWVEQGSAYVETGLSIDGTAAIYSISFIVDDNFTKELTDGSSLWVNFVTEEDVDWFDLEGAKLAIGLAKLGCMQHLMQQKGAPSPRDTSSTDQDADLDRQFQSQT